MTSLSQCHNIEDLRQMARARLPRGLFEFVDRGAEDESALRHNRAVFERIRFRPRVLSDVSARRQDVSLFGKAQPMPITIAPTGTAGLMWYRGEIELARAAASAGIPFTLATGSLTAMEVVAGEAGGTLWFQIYMFPDRALSHRLVDRAKNAGFEALVVTVDGPVPGNREYNLRNGFTLPFTVTRRNIMDMLRRPGWLAGVLGRYVATTGMPRYENYPQEVKQRLTAGPVGRSIVRNDALSWDDLRALRRAWPHKLLVKGVLHPADATRAADCGADGVVVSNHGGRNLDGAISPIEALPPVLDAVGHRIRYWSTAAFGAALMWSRRWLWAHMQSRSGGRRCMRPRLAVRPGLRGLSGSCATRLIGSWRSLVAAMLESFRVSCSTGLRGPDERFRRRQRREGGGALGRAAGGPA